MGDAGKTLRLLSGDITALMPDTPEMPGMKPLPAPVETVDVSGQKQYSKAKLKSKKGRASTVLTKLGSNDMTKRETLG